MRLASIGDLLGIEDCFNMSQLRTTTLKCNSQTGELLVINYSDLMCNLNLVESSYTLLKNFIKEREESKAKQLECAKIRYNMVESSKLRRSFMGFNYVDNSNKGNNNGFKLPESSNILQASKYESSLKLPKISLNYSSLTIKLDSPKKSTIKLNRLNDGNHFGNKPYNDFKPFMESNKVKIQYLNYFTSKKPKFNSIERKPNQMTPKIKLLF